MKRAIYKELLAVGLLLPLLSGCPSASSPSSPSSPSASMPPSSSSGSSGSSGGSSSSSGGSSGSSSSGGGSTSSSNGSSGSSTSGADLQAQGARRRLQPVGPHRGQARRVVAAIRARAPVGRVVQIQPVEVMVPVRAILDLATRRVVTFHFQVSSTKFLPTVAVPRPPMRRVRETQDHKDSREELRVQAELVRAPRQRKPRRAAALPAARALKTVWSPTGVPLTP